MIVNESVLKAASVVQRFGFHQNCFYKLFVDGQHLVGRVQGARPVPHQEVALRPRRLSQLKIMIFSRLMLSLIIL